MSHRFAGAVLEGARLATPAKVETDRRRIALAESDRLMGLVEAANLRDRREPWELRRRIYALAARERIPLHGGRCCMDDLFIIQDRLLFRIRGYVVEDEEEE